MNYDTHLIMQELSKFNLKINVLPSKLKKYMNLNINNKLIFIERFQILSSSLVKFKIWVKLNFNFLS